MSVLFDHLVTNEFDSWKEPMTELSFLIDLLLNHDLPKATKDLLALRIKEVEEKLSFVREGFIVGDQLGGGVYSGKMIPRQAPSTLAAMARHGEVPPLAVAAPLAPPEPVAVIAQTPATAAAMQARNDSINAALSGKTDKTTGRPRKW